VRSERGEVRHRPVIYMVAWPWVGGQASIPFLSDRGSGRSLCRPRNPFLPISCAAYSSKSCRVGIQGGGAKVREGMQDRK